MLTQVLPLLTVADLEALPDDDKKYELIGGEPLVSRAAHIHHQLVITNLVGAFFAYLSTQRIGKIIPEPGVIFSEYDAVIPDLVFVTNETYSEILSPEGKLTSAPEIVIEILSQGAQDIRRDKVLKRNLYGRYEVKEYWIVDLSMLSVEVYRLEENGLELSERLRLEDFITSPLLPNFKLKVSEIFMF